MLRSPQKKSTLTIRINQELKDAMMTLAHASGEDLSTWIRRFFETIQRQNNIKKGIDEEEMFSEECINTVLSASKNGQFQRFDIAEYV
jgi:antitoxin component of RelBE/YafQ-DinJ toxin-antitoxin module